MSSPPTPMLQDRLERPLRDLRISVTDRCNFRCPYCMPAELYPDDYGFLQRKEILTFEEIERLARIFVGLGVRKVRITGGEPLVRAQLPELIRQLASIEGVDDLALTTNGSLLPGAAQDLARAGLRRVTVSLDSLDDQVFEAMNGGRGVGVQRVLDGIAAAERAGLTPIKINCVVQRGVNDEGLVELACHFRGTGHILRFIEFMDVGTLNDWDLDKVVPAPEILDRLGAELPLEPIDPNYPGEVARRFRYRDGSGEIGIIASVSQPFCGACTRARISADGHLVTCLFAAGGKDLKTALRGGATDDELRELITGIWTVRADRYSEERSSHTDFGSSRRERRRLEMYRIGG
jgi:cyclic pyranopterin phosphate synthase